MRDLTSDIRNAVFDWLRRYGSWTLLRNDNLVVSGLRLGKQVSGFGLSPCRSDTTFLTHCVNWTFISPPLF